MSQSTTKPTKWLVHPAKTVQQKTDQTGRMPRYIRVFAGCTGHFVGFVVLQLMFAYFVKTGNCAPITFILAIRRNRVLPTNTADLMMDPSSHFGIAGLPFNIVISIAQSSLNKPCVQRNYISFQRPVWTIVEDPDETAPQCSWRSSLIRD